LSALPFDTLFEFDNSGRTRGHSLKLRKHRSRLDLRLYFFSERVVSTWMISVCLQRHWILSRAT